MDSNSHQYQTIVLIEHLRGCLGANEDDGYYYHDCSEQYEHGHGQWDGSIKDVPFDRETMLQHDFYLALLMASAMGPNNHGETNAEFAALHGITKRQASKVRRLMRRMYHG